MTSSEFYNAAQSGKYESVCTGKEQERMERRRYYNDLYDLERLNRQIKED